MATACDAKGTVQLQDFILSSGVTNLLVGYLDIYAAGSGHQFLRRAVCHQEKEKSIRKRKNPHHKTANPIPECSRHIYLRVKKGGRNETERFVCGRDAERENAE